MNHSEVAKRYVEYCLGLTSKDSGKGSRCSYEGHRFVSYATTVAVYHPEYKLLAMAVKRYSMTTARHKDYVLSACSTLGLRFVLVDDVYYPKGASNIARMAAEAKSNLADAIRARKYVSLSGYRHRLEQAKSYAESVGLPFNPDEFSPATLLADQPKLLQKYVVRRLDGTYQSVNA